MLIGPDGYNIKKYPKKHFERLSRIKKLLDGQCIPTGWKDVYLEACKNI